MGLRMKKEWLYLDMLYCIGMIIYISVQFFCCRHIADWLFLGLLTLATLFLNYRQKKLYEILLIEESGEAFWKELEDGGTKKEKAEKMFLDRRYDIGAVIFALLFCCIMWQFHIWKDIPGIKIAFVFYLFFANIPTGLAIIRLLLYFTQTVQWIHTIKFDVGINNAFAVKFVKRVRNNVLFTAVTYCTLSLSSMLFTDIEINIIVILYTCFAAFLVISSLVITDLLLVERTKHNIDISLQKINDVISSNISAFIENGGNDKTAFVRIQRLTEVKSYMESQKITRLDIGKIISNIGLVIITIIPVILQWLLDSLKF